jgi:hypothetical protein
MPLAASQPAPSPKRAVMYDGCSTEAGGLKCSSATTEDNQKNKVRPLVAFQSSPSPKEAIVYDGCSAEAGGLKYSSTTT